MGAEESYIFIAVNDGLMVVCDDWAHVFDGATVQGSRWSARTIDPDGPNRSVRLLWPDGLRF